MTYIYLALAAFSVGWFANRMIGDKQRSQEAREYRDRGYSDAISSIRSSDWNKALFHLSLSIGRAPSFEAYDALGTVWGRLKRWDLAAEAYRRARNLAGYGPGSPYDKSRECIPNSEEVCRLFEQESLAHARDFNWEFAYLRSREALHLIREGRIPTYLSHGDGESWIRMIHMVATIQFLEREEAISVAKEDAYWILENSGVPGYKELAHIVVEKPSDFQQLRALLLQYWSTYDGAIRQEGPIISEPSKMRGSSTGCCTPSLSQ